MLFAEYQRSGKVIQKKFNSAVLAASRRATGMCGDHKVLSFCFGFGDYADPTVFAKYDFPDDVWKLLDEFAEKVRTH